MEKQECDRKEEQEAATPWSHVVIDRRSSPSNLHRAQAWQSGFGFEPNTLVWCGGANSQGYGVGRTLDRRFVDGAPLLPRPNFVAQPAAGGSGATSQLKNPTHNGGAHKHSHTDQRSYPPLDSTGARRNQESPALRAPSPGSSASPALSPASKVGSEEQASPSRTRHVLERRERTTPTLPSHGLVVGAVG